MKNIVKYLAICLFSFFCCESGFGQSEVLLYPSSIANAKLLTNFESPDANVDPETNPVSLDLDILGGLLVELSEAGFESRPETNTSTNSLAYIAALKMGFRKVNKFWIGSELTAIYMPGERAWPFGPNPECINCPPILSRPTDFEELGRLRTQSSWFFSTSLWLGRNVNNFQFSAFAGLGFRYDPSATASTLLGDITAASHISPTINYGLSINYKFSKNFVIRADTRFITTFPGTMTIGGSFSREAQVANTHFTSLIPSVGIGIVL